MSIVAYCDGSSLKGGGAGAGVVLTGTNLVRCSLPIGKGTNNEAEYHAILLAIQKINSMPSIGFDEEIVIFTDSELAVKQIKRQAFFEDYVPHFFVLRGVRISLALF